MEYQCREITVEYYIEGGRIYLDGINFKGREVSHFVNNEKIGRDMAEAIYQKGVYEEEANADL